MGSKSSKKTRVPPPPAPVPQRTELSAGNQYDQFLKMRRRAGRQGTILTGLGGEAQTLGLMGLA